MLLIRRVVGHSMQPRFRPGKLIIAWRKRRVKVGDVVVARIGGTEHLKRVSQRVDDELWLLGDNQLDSLDSRSYGSVKDEMIIGVVPGWWR